MSYKCNIVYGDELDNIPFIIHSDIIDVSINECDKLLLKIILKDNNIKDIFSTLNASKNKSYYDRQKYFICSFSFINEKDESIYKITHKYNEKSVNYSLVLNKEVKDTLILNLEFTK